MPETTSENAIKARQNRYIEFRKWVPFWGLFLDSEKEVQALMNKYNTEGWTCTHFQFALMPKLSIGQFFMIMLAFLLTLGFMQFWVGGVFLFEKNA